MDWRKYTSAAMAATVAENAHHHLHAHVRHASAPAISTATLSCARATATSIPLIVSLRSSFVPRKVSVSLVAMRRESSRLAVSPSGLVALSFFAVAVASSTLPFSLPMFPACCSTILPACSVFFVIGSIILRAFVGALWHDVRSIVRTIKFRAGNSRLIVLGFTQLFYWIYLLRWFFGRPTGRFPFVPSTCVEHPQNLLVHRLQFCI